MKKRNAIGKLVWLRGVREKSARRKLASAHGEEQSAYGELEGAVARMAAHQAPEDIITPAELRALQVQGFKLQEIVVAAEVLHADRLQRLVDSRDEWRSAAADLDSAENLRDRRLVDEATKARAAAERALDDLQVTRRARLR
jgi:hypothetical protein